MRKRLKRLELDVDDVAVLCKARPRYVRLFPILCLVSFLMFAAAAVPKKSPDNSVPSKHFTTSDRIPVWFLLPPLGNWELAVKAAVNYAKGVLETANVENMCGTS